LTDRERERAAVVPFFRPLPVPPCFPFARATAGICFAGCVGDGGGMEEPGAGVLVPETWRTAVAAAFALEALGARGLGGAFGVGCAAVSGAGRG
jgi:hypothetical protein